jgi:hypothetical protein
MNPESIRLVAQIRHEFYHLFAEAMQVPVDITKGNSSTNIARASWADNRQQLNYICVYAHTAPDELVPDRPLVLRLAVNKGGGFTTTTKMGRSCQGLNQRWHFELTLMPDEILEFLPWIVHLVQSAEKGNSHSIPEPPYPLNCHALEVNSLRHACTERASNRLSQQLMPL